MASARAIKAALFLADFALTALATVLTLLIRENFFVASERWAHFAPYFGITMAVAFIVLAFANLDRSLVRLSTFSDYVRIVVAAAAIVAMSVAIGFLLNRMDGVARSLPLIQFVNIVVLLVGVRVYHRLRIVSRDHTLSYKEPVAAADSRQEIVLLIGWGAVLEHFVRAAAELSRGRMSIAGILSPQARHVGRQIQNVKVIGTAEDVEAKVAELGVHGIAVNRIIVTMDFDRLSDAAKKSLDTIQQAGNIRVDSLAECFRLVPGTDESAA